MLEIVVVGVVKLMLFHSFINFIVIQLLSSTDVAELNAS